MNKMIVVDDTYRLTKKNYHDKPHDKHQIVIGSTLSDNMNHYNGWKTRYGGTYKRTAPFTISMSGTIHQHYSPELYSDFFGIADLDEHVIPILIENEGWLTKDIINNGYINYVGNIYNRRESVYEKQWRGQKYWAPYTKEQIDSTIVLCKYLCGMFDILVSVVSHNTKFEGVYEYNGVVYKSNYNKYYSDLSPAWEYGEFKNKLELN